MTRAKRDGTRWESELVQAAKDAGLGARRLAEGGSKDLGDVAIWGPRADGPEDYFIIECRARANGNQHQWLADAKRKAKGHSVAVAWKRLTRKDGNKRRTPDGERVVVAVDLDTFFALVRGDHLGGGDG